MESDNYFSAGVSVPTLFDEPTIIEEFSADAEHFMEKQPGDTFQGYGDESSIEEEEVDYEDVDDRFIIASKEEEDFANTFYEWLKTVDGMYECWYDRVLSSA